MKLLLDTNIFLEVMLGQKEAVSAQRLLAAGQQHELFVSDFSLHSIGCHLFRRGKASEFKQFFRDVVVTGGIRIASLGEQQYEVAADAAAKFRLDFDDAYQYAVARTQGLSIISFDADFDRTHIARRGQVG